MAKAHEGIEVGYRPGGNYTRRIRLQKREAQQGTVEASRRGVRVWRSRMSLLKRRLGMVACGTVATADAWRCPAPDRFDDRRLGN
jgi:hypothetical protein